MSDDSHQPEPTSLSDILYAVLEEGRFQAVMLASADGLPIARAPAGYKSDLAAALVAMLRKASGEAQSQLGLAEVDEVTVRSRDRVSLVCRRLDLRTEELILVVTVPPGRRYRRTTNQAIAQIKALLS
jgi:predicted regulator of Ras-like GTPase activity (Roadblock/LC7/MglB family)